MDDQPHPDTDAEFGTGLRAHMGLAASTQPQTAAAAPEPARAEGPPAVEELEARSRTIREAGAELEARERRLAAQQRELAAEAARLAREQAELEQLTGTAGRPVPAVLRERAEQHVERLWRSLFSALDATRADGSADFATRVAAARALLATAYPEAAVAEEPGDELPDELALLRARRADLGLT